MKTIVTLFTGLILSLSALAQTAAELAAIDLAKQGKTPEAIAAFEKIIAADGHNVNAIDVLAQLYLRSGQTNESYTTATKGLALDAKNINLNITKAKAAMALNKDDEAIALMDGLIANDPNFFFAYYMKGTVLDDQNKVQLAIGMYSKSIQLNPEYAFNYLSRAEDFASISRYEQALGDYNKFISMVTDNDEAFNMRGMTNYRLGKNQEAIADYSKAIELNKDQKYALVNRGIIYAAAGERDKALADYNQAIAIDPDHYSDPYYQLASLYQKEKNYGPAQKNIEKALSIKTSLSHYYALYSKILLSENKNTEGLAAAEKVLAMDKVNADGYFLKATAYSNMEKYDDAISVINEGIKLYPQNYLFYSLRSAVYKFKGNTAMAEADDQKAKELGTKN